MKNALLIFFLSFSILSFSQEKFKKVKAHPSIQLEIPVSFSEMLEEDMAERYSTSRKPTMVYTDVNKEVDLDVNITINRWGGDDIALLKDFYKSNVRIAHKKVEFIKDEVVEIKKRKYAWLEFKSSFDDRGRGVKKHYTLILLTVVEDKIVVFSFRTKQRAMKKWQPIAQQIMNSIKIKKKLNIEDEEGYTPEDKARIRKQKAKQEKEEKKAEKQ